MGKYRYDIYYYDGIPTSDRRPAMYPGEGVQHIQKKFDSDEEALRYLINDIFLEYESDEEYKKEITESEESMFEYLDNIDIGSGSPDCLMIKNLDTGEDIYGSQEVVDSFYEEDDYDETFDGNYSDINTILAMLNEKHKEDSDDTDEEDSLNETYDYKADEDDYDEYYQNPENIEMGSLVDFGAYGKLYVVRNMNNEYFWVTDLEEERFNPNAPGWSINKELAKSIVENPYNESFNRFKNKKFKEAFELNDDENDLEKIKKNVGLKSIFLNKRKNYPQIGDIIRSRNDKLLYEVISEPYEEFDLLEDYFEKYGENEDKEEFVDKYIKYFIFLRVLNKKYNSTKGEFVPDKTLSEIEKYDFIHKN